VHLCDFPSANKEIVEKEVEEVFNLFKRVVEAGRALRSRLKLKLRQPLKQLTIVSKNPLTEKMRLLLGDHIKDELNVKDLLFSESEEDLVSVRVRPVTPILGPRLGNRLKLLAEALAKLSLRDVVEIESSGFFTFQDMKIPTEHLLIERTSLRDDVETLFDVSVFFNTEIDRSLYLEMLSREFINRVQKLRKDMKFELTDRIKILFRSDDADLNDAVKSHVSDIKAECLALEVVSSDLADVQVEDIESCNLFLKLERMDGFS
jgi:isoleucyl-tRNA synthetase